MAGPFQFQIISDLHLESHPSYDDFELLQTAPCLALLGDIGHAESDQLLKFLERQVRRYDIVFYLLGNNEPYGIDFPTTKQRVGEFAHKVDDLRAKSEISGRFVFLDQTRYDVDECTTILGCTLFSNILHEEAEAVSERMGDFHHIQNWDVARHNEAHKSDLLWLNEQVRQISTSEPSRSIIIFTHFSPTLVEQANNPRHRGGGITSGFVTDLRGEQCWESSSVSLWAFGHTHYNCDFYESGKRLLANQRGSFASPQSTFAPGRVYDVGVSTLNPLHHKHRLER